MGLKCWLEFQGERLYRSLDRKTWTEVVNGLITAADRSWYTSSISADGTKMLAGVYNGRIYRSLDSGETWTEVKPAGDLDKTWNTTSINSDGTKMLAGTVVVDFIVL